MEWKVAFLDATCEKVVCPPRSLDSRCGVAGPVNGFLEQRFTGSGLGCILCILGCRLELLSCGLAFDKAFSNSSLALGSLESAACLDMKVFALKDGAAAGLTCTLFRRIKP